MQSSLKPWALGRCADVRAGQQTPGHAESLRACPNFTGWWLSHGFYPLLQCCSVPVCSHAVGQAKPGYGRNGCWPGLGQVPWGERKDSQRQRSCGMLPGWVSWFSGRVCCLFAHLSLLPSIYHTKNQLQYVAPLTLLAYSGHHCVVHSCEQVNAVGSFPSE